MKENLAILLVTISLFILPIFSHNTTKNEAPHQNTFLIKTKLNKEQLEALLNQRGESNVNLKEKIIPEKNENEEKNMTTVKEIKEEDDTLQEQIENEIQEDALHPLDEFHVKEVKTSETTTFIAKPQNRLIDSLYEKRFGNTFGLLAGLFIFMILIFGYLLSLSNSISKRNGGKNYQKNSYRELFNSENSKEYLLFKNK